MCVWKESTENVVVDDVALLALGLDLDFRFELPACLRFSSNFGFDFGFDSDYVEASTSRFPSPSVAV